jgi:hypothetical protein
MLRRRAAAALPLHAASSNPGASVTDDAGWRCAAGGCRRARLTQAGALWGRRHAASCTIALGHASAVGGLLQLLLIGRLLIIGLIWQIDEPAAPLAAWAVEALLWQLRQLQHP